MTKKTSDKKPIKIPRIEPAGHRVLVLPDPVEEKSEGGIIIHYKGSDLEAEQMGQITGTLVAVGKQAWRAFSPDYKGEPWAKVGQRVYYARYAGKYIVDPDDSDVSYVILNDDDITGIELPKEGDK